MKSKTPTVLSLLLLIAGFGLVFTSSSVFGQQSPATQMPDDVRQKFSKYVGNWNIEDRIDGEVKATGRLSLRTFAHGEGFEYHYVGGDPMSGDKVHSIGIIGWDALKQKLVEFNIDNSGSTFSSVFTNDDQGGYSAPISGVGLNQNGKVVPFEGDRTLAHSGDRFSVRSKAIFDGESQEVNSTFTRISEEESEQAAVKAFHVYDEYFNGVWDIERKVGEETTKGILTVDAAPTRNAHLVTIEYENGESVFDLFSYNQRSGSWGGVFNDRFGHGGFSIMDPLSIAKIEPGFKTQTTYVGSGSLKNANWTLANWHVIGLNNYTITISDRLVDAPDVLLTMRRRIPKGKSNGAQVFASYSDLVRGDHWKTTQNDTEIDHAYTQLISGKFVNFCATGGPVPAVATIGVDPKTGHCTWWIVNEEQGAGRMIMTQVSEDQWRLTQVEGGVRYDGLTTRKNDDTIEQKIIEYTVNGEAVLPKDSVFIWKRQR